MLVLNRPTAWKCTIYIFNDMLGNILEGVDGLDLGTLTRESLQIWGRQEGISRGVSTVSCQPALDVHSPARSPLPTSNLRAARTLFAKNEQTSKQ